MEKKSSGIPADVKKWIQDQIKTYNQYVTDLTADDPSFAGLRNDYGYFLEGVLEGQLEAGNLPPGRDVKTMGWLLEKYADEVRVMFESSQSTDKTLQQFKESLKQEDYDKARSLYEQLGPDQQRIADEMATEVFAGRQIFKKITTDIFNLARNLTRKGHIEEAQKLLSVIRRQDKVRTPKNKK